MKSFYLGIVLLLFTQALPGQEEAGEKLPSTFTLQLNQDNVFGFYPVVVGSWGLNDKISFTYYGTFWTNPWLGSPDNGTNFWLETGAGLLFFAAKGKWLINPTIGFTHGRLLSGGTQGVIGDGIVPGVTSFYTGDVFDGEWYSYYYKSLRSSGPVTSDYLLYWIYPGIRLSEKITLGLHHESLVLTRTTGGPSDTFYRWLGGFIKFNIDNRYIFRLAAGKNFDEDTGYSPEYYKLTANLNF